MCSQESLTWCGRVQTKNTKRNPDFTPVTAWIFLGTKSRGNTSSDYLKPSLENLGGRADGSHKKQLHDLVHLSPLNLWVQYSSIVYYDILSIPYMKCFMTVWRRYDMLCPAELKINLPNIVVLPWAHLKFATGSCDQKDPKRCTCPLDRSELQQNPTLTSYLATPLWSTYATCPLCQSHGKIGWLHPHSPMDHTETPSNCSFCRRSSSQDALQAKMPKAAYKHKKRK